MRIIDLYGGIVHATLRTLTRKDSSALESFLSLTRMEVFMNVYRNKRLLKGAANDCPGQRAALIAAISVSKTTEVILQLLDRLNQEGRTIILVTHESEVGARAKRVIWLRDGESSRKLKIRLTN